jgi:PAS domain S-box-containing protein
MKVESKHEAEESVSSASSEYKIFESLNYPVSIIDINGITVYGNKAYQNFFHSGDVDVRLDWEHPFFPEYRKRIAQAYISALNGNEKQCFAIINTPEGTQVPVEIYLFPMYRDGHVSLILALMIIVDNRLLSFDRSTLSIISEENFQYDNLHFEFSPLPIIRMDEDINIIRCSHSLEGYIGYSSEEILIENTINVKSLFIYDYEKIRNAVHIIMDGSTPFQRLGEVKLKTKDDTEKIANITLYPIVQNNEISSIELIIEDLTRIRELKDTITTMSKMQLFSDITEGFLHTLNNTINVIMSKTQLLLQITEKDSVTSGIKTIEESAHNMADQIKRIQNFISYKELQHEESVEPMVNVIEDAIEFTRMQFKVDGKDNKKRIDIDKKYFTRNAVKTDTKLLREIITSIILKVASHITKKGIISITLKESKDLFLHVSIPKDKENDQKPVFPIFC